jgi:hypothetical protein
MVWDWLHEREDGITPLASYVRQVALMVLSKIAKGFVCVMFLWSSCNIPDSSVSEYSSTNISNSGVSKYCVTQKVWYF